MTKYVDSISVPRSAFLGGESWNLIGLTDVTVLFGKNGSGKSLLLRAWRDSSVEDTHYVTPERTGEMDFQPQYLQQELTPAGRKDSSTRNYVPEYRRRIIGRIQSYFLTRGDHRGADAPPASPEDVESLVNTLVTDFDLELRASANPPYALTRAPDGQQVGGVDQLSSGEAQLVTIALDMLTIAAIWEIEGRESRVMLIDEPDAHIHPDLEVRFSDFLFQAIDRFDLQVVIATHSTSLLAALGQFGGEKTSAIYLTRSRTDFAAQKFNDIQKELAACLGGHALMGPLFGAPLLLVEGDDDYRIWSQVPRHHVTNFSVIPSRGEEIKKYQKSLERIFGSLREEESTKSGFALIDADKGKPTPDANNPQNHIQFIQLACHESENLYLTDEVLAELGIDWETAAAKIVEYADKFGNKADQLANAKRWDRMHDDIKNCVQEVSAILDSKHVHWTVRVGRAIGKSKPTGQLEQFLGPEVVDALWDQ